MRHGRQSQRIRRQQGSVRQSPLPAARRYTGESTIAGERRQALLALILLAIVFTGGTVTYVVLAAGEVFG